MLHNTSNRHFTQILCLCQESSPFCKVLLHFLAGWAFPQLVSINVERKKWSDLVLTSCWLSIGPRPPSPGCRWWWWCGRCCRPRAPRSSRSGSWRRRSDGSRRSWCRPCRWCSRSGRWIRSSRAAAAGLGSRDSLYGVATRPVQPGLLGQSLD